MRSIRRAVFLISAAVLVAIGLSLLRMMPTYRPTSGTPYPRVLSSMLSVMRTMPAVRWRAAYQSLMFCAFNMFWTAAPLFLADRFHLGERGIGVFDHSSISLSGISLASVSERGKCSESTAPTSRMAATIPSPGRPAFTSTISAAIASPQVSGVVIAVIAAINVAVVAYRRRQRRQREREEGRPDVKHTLFE